MHDVEPFGIIVAVFSFATLLAVLSNRIGEKLRIPAPAIFLVVAAVVSDLLPRFGEVTFQTDQRIVTVALMFILFDGGMHIGWHRFRQSAGAVAWIGIAGTAVTAGGMAVAAHYIFGFSWLPALLLGTALAPTDPAVVFAVLGRREISGTTGTILEGESGANDPVAIALMLSLLAATGSGWGAVTAGIGQFGLQMLLGGVFGVVGGLLLKQVMHRITLPLDALYPVQTMAFAGLIYGVTAACHGSGYLAVFLAGIMVGDIRAPYKREIEHFASAVGTLSEIIVFTVLGLTINLRNLFHSGLIWTGNLDRASADSGCAPGTRRVNFAAD